ncbi:transporter substrate-binding domain-containing protein [Pseudoalteromonas sp. Angola-31]|nr:transporter substrate-binding domain-containing protein [Pseudoalteromonas sp. Angola-31]
MTKIFRTFTLSSMPVFTKFLIILHVLLISSLSHANEPLTLLSRANASTDGFLNSDKTFESLLNHTINTKLQWTNQARLIKRLMGNEAVCSYDIIKTPEREKHILFSNIPTTIYEQRKIYAFKRTLQNFPERVSVAQLLEKDFTLAVDSGTSYQKLEPVLTKYNEQIAAISSEDTSSQLPQLLIHNRIDMIVDYEVNVLGALTNEQLKQIDSREIAEFPEFVNGYFACSKSELGEKVIKTINILMNTPEIYDRLQKSLQQAYSADTSSAMMLAYSQEHVYLTSDE